MLCPNCHGTRFVTADGRPVPCPECGGLGEIHCCDGLQEQYDPAADADQPPVPPPPSLCGPVTE
jgi:hypothetical protein